MTAPPGRVTGAVNPKAALRQLGIAPKPRENGEKRDVLGEKQWIDEKVAKYVLETPAATGRPMESYSDEKLYRLMYEVAPLVARGATLAEIADACGTSLAVAESDKLNVGAIWKEMAEQSGDPGIYREIAVQRQEFMYKEAMEAWAMSRNSGRPNVKLLEQANKILENLHKIQGILLDMTLVQNNTNFGREAMSAEQLGELFS
jgi:hypothetical protein